MSHTGELAEAYTDGTPLETHPKGDQRAAGEQKGERRPNTDRWEERAKDVSSLMLSGV